MSPTIAMSYWLVLAGSSSGKLSWKVSGLFEGRQQNVKSATEPYCSAEWLKYELSSGCAKSNVLQSYT